MGIKRLAPWRNANLYVFKLKFDHLVLLWHRSYAPRVVPLDTRARPRALEDNLGPAPALYVPELHQTNYVWLHTRSS